MLKDVHEALAKFRVRLRPTKYKAQANCFANPVLGTHPICEGLSMEVVSADADFVILGTKMALVLVMEAELQHRTSTAWREFESLKTLLLHRDASIKL